ncbi:MAG: hypothetical protein ACYC0F_03500 [Rhodanobacter sp.]
MEVRVVEPPVKIKLVRVRKQYQMREKQLVTGQELMPERADTQKWGELVEKYRLIETQQDGLTAADAARASGSRTFDLTSRREKRTFSPLTLVAEVSRYLNRSPLEIEELLDATKEGMDELVAITNEFNELLVRRDHSAPVPSALRLRRVAANRGARGRPDQVAPEWLLRGVGGEGQDRPDARRANKR